MCRPLARDFSALTGSDSSNADSGGKIPVKTENDSDNLRRVYFVSFLFYLLVFRCVERGDLFFFQSTKAEARQHHRREELLHTFLIRNPFILCKSWTRKMLRQGMKMIFVFCCYISSVEETHKFDLIQIHKISL